MRRLVRSHQRPRVQALPRPAVMIAAQEAVVVVVVAAGGRGEERGGRRGKKGKRGVDQKRIGEHR